MVSNSTAYAPALTRDETGKLLGQTMGLVALTAAFFSLGAYLGRDMVHQWGWLFFIASILCLVGINATAERSEQAAVGLLFAFGLLIGLAVSPTIAYYASADPQALWQAGAATALFIAGFGAAGYATRHDLSAAARGFYWVLLGLIAFGIVAIFVNIPHGALIYSIVGLVVFAGLTAFDFQRLRRTRDIRQAPVMAASIFLDILNVFTLLLSFWGGAGKDE
jgi:modulator of FtsH protease